MGDNGWVKLYRRFIHSDLWLSEKFTRGQAWVDLIALANHRDGFFRKRGVKVEVKRGQCGYSELALADRWQWSRGKVRRFLKELEKDEKIVQQKSKLTTLIDIINYEKYQGGDTTDSTTTEQQTVQQPNTNKNDKNGKNGKNKEKNKKKKAGPLPPSSVDEVINFFTENGYTQEAAQRAYHYYQDADWHDVNGKPVRSWKQKMRGVWFKPENEIDSKGDRHSGFDDIDYSKGINNDGRF